MNQFAWRAHTYSKIHMPEGHTQKKVLRSVIRLSVKYPLFLSNRSGASKVFKYTFLILRRPLISLGSPCVLCHIIRVPPLRKIYCLLPLRRSVSSLLKDLWVWASCHLKGRSPSFSTGNASVWLKNVLTGLETSSQINPTVISLCSLFAVYWLTRGVSIQTAIYTIT